MGPPTVLVGLFLLYMLLEVTIFQHHYRLSDVELLYQPTHYVVGFFIFITYFWNSLDTQESFFSDYNSLFDNDFRDAG
jgi:ABC-type tungstate transport system substrate-binding protein